MALLTDIQHAAAEEPARLLVHTRAVVAIATNGAKATARIAGRHTVFVRGNKLMRKASLAVGGNGKVDRLARDQCSDPFRHGKLTAASTR